MAGSWLRSCKVMGIFMAASSVVPFGVSLYWGADSGRFVSSGVAAEGVVMRSEAVREDGETLYEDVISFEDASGVSREFTPDYRSSQPREVGSRVEVLYDGENPEEARICSFCGLWLGPAAMALVGFVSLGLGGLVYFGKLRRFVKCG